MMVSDRPRTFSESNMTQQTLYSTGASTLEVNKLLKNTYMLLSMT